MINTQVIAHRGASAISPENTLIAFKRAIEIGVHAIETDVQMTKDGQLVIIHDEKLERTTNGKGWVKDYTLRELKDLDAGSWFSSTYIGETIPTLDEFFQLIYHTPLWVNLEMKMGFVFYPGIEEALIKKVQEFNMEDRVIISSFNHYSVAKVKKLAPTLKTAILFSSGLYEPWKYAKHIGATFLHPSKEVVYPDMIAKTHRAGMGVNIYTVDDKEEMAKLINMEIDGIITNVPDRLILLIKEMSKITN